MNPYNILSIDEYLVGETRNFNVGMATSLGKGKLFIQTSLTPIRIDLESYRPYTWV